MNQADPKKGDLFVLVEGATFYHYGPDAFGSWVTTRYICGKDTLIEAAGVMPTHLRRSILIFWKAPDGKEYHAHLENLEVASPEEMLALMGDDT